MEQLIKTVNLSKRYELGTQEVRALDSVSIEIRRNEFVAIMGPSGSGKSTLMNLLGCLDTATEGDYFLNGKNVSVLSEDELAEIRNKEIGFVFQTFNLMPRLRAEENVELPLVYAGVHPRERKVKALQALEQVDLSKRAKHKSNELSGGERQRVAIARALVNDPSIILADEPTGNLDSRSGKDIMAIFSKLHEQGQTIIIVTHEREIADCARRLILLRDGKVEQDTVT
ncbi:MAG: macrolide ABC transporter ATP-binding protein [Candidatus Fischerbacteria bacterium RBG_13_37_8]|uniref:Macrolide ABC transporter ATP-binding protein n=1 Tax=Candidatus Fischerbacteria bacterium RBG_13_37_8 TaxID=1817863 RepID=A0A1F5V6Q3_9BACT|nr:MAG: macrolide ABC transporter ATP-binding protein [Candidatus Fischerbacteria bacterium RBG_13_37_8]